MKYFIAILFSTYCLAACQQVVDQQEAESITEKASISGQIYSIQENIKAGDQLNIGGTINIPPSKKAEVQLLLHHSLYSKIYSINLNDGKFNLQVPGKENELSGEVICRLIYRDKVLDEEKIFIGPIGAVDKIQNFNGPKSLFANDDDGSMNVSIPHDKYDNPLLPPSIVNYQSSYNGEIEKSEKKEIDHLVAYQINPAKKREGKYLIGSSVNDGFSQEQELIIGAAMPVDFTIELVSHYPYSDARQYMHLKTSVMKDSWDNIVADGTLILFTIMETGEVIGAYQAFAIGGIANVYIENPSKATQWKIQGGLHDELYSNEIKVEFSKNVNDFPLTLNSAKNKLSIGPVVGILGQLAPDGTEVKISIKDSDLEDFLFLEDGKLNYKLGFDWLEKEPRQLEVLIGGHLKTINIE